MSSDSPHDPRHWDSVYSSDASFFGEGPSILARQSLAFLKKQGSKTILELGCGQGRDALFFAKNGFNVRAFDYSEMAISQLKRRLVKLRLENRVTVLNVDFSAKLPPIPKDHVDVVYSHLFFCMPFTDKKLEKIFDFVYDALPAKRGLHIFSIRNKNKDNSYGKGKLVAKDTFEINGFKVRFHTSDEILKFNHSHRFKIIKMTEAYEEPCSLILIFSKPSKHS